MSNTNKLIESAITTVLVVSGLAAIKALLEENRSEIISKKGKKLLENERDFNLFKTKLDQEIQSQKESNSGKIVIKLD